MIRVAINGFGRIGRLALRLGLQEANIQIVGINDLTDNKTMTHLFKYDSVHRKFKGQVDLNQDKLVVDKTSIQLFSQPDPSNLPWKELNVDVVLECTGVFTTRETASKHLIAGAKKVILSAPAKSDDIPMVVVGVNDHILDGSEDIVSNASCTTNCLAPIVHVLDKEFGLVKGFITTVHAYTSTQRLQDSPHKDARRSRAAAVSMIPTTTGAAKAIGKVLPHLEGKLDGKAIRVPTPDGSITDLVAILKIPVTKEEIDRAIVVASQHELKGILQYTEDPLVSVDIIGNTHSSIYDSQLTSCNEELVKIYAWYDNEMGYAARLIDLLVKIG